MSRPNRYLVLLFVGAILGLLFASVSTRDFAMHLDREVHDVTCSFTPGLSGPEVGESGCLVTMISPYSSVLREWVWGGVPIALPAMAVFAFLLAFGVELVLSGRQRGRRATLFLALATALPVAASMVMAAISLFEVGAVCKLCVGIYVASALCLAGGLGAWIEARRGPGVASRAPRRPAPVLARDLDEAGDDPAFLGGRPAAQPAAQPAAPVEPEPEPEPVPALADARDFDDRSLLVAFAVGVLFVVMPVMLYAAAAPDHSGLIGSCGALAEGGDGDDAPTLSLSRGDVPAIEILDPLCPACAQFEERLETSGQGEALAREALLFPLDEACNWMVDDSVHPGACSISEAILCAEDDAGEILAWSFENQEEILAAERAEVGAAARMVTTAFPKIASCVGSPKAKARLNRSLRWAVDNQIQVKTPQLFVDGVKLCDEDVDLGLSFMLSRMIERQRLGTLAALGTDPIEVAPSEADDDGVAPAAPSETEEAPADSAADPAPTPPADPAPTPAADPAPKSAPEPAPKSAPAPPPTPAAEPAPARDEPAPADDAPAADDSPSDDSPSDDSPSDDSTDDPADEDTDTELFVPDPGSDSPEPSPGDEAPATEDAP